MDYLHCKKVNLIVSLYFAGVERNKLIPYMRREFSGKLIEVAVVQSHCKIALIFSEKGNVLISGNVNLSSSNNVEQFVIMHNEKTIAYGKKRIDNIMRRFTMYSGLESKISTVNSGANTGKRTYETFMRESV